jgi:DnaJ-class molecular chaperone
MNSTQKDLYRILGVIDSAEVSVIKAAYKAMMMIYHPDKHPSDKNEFINKSKEINEAYSILGDPDKRKKYDTERYRKSKEIFLKPEHRYKVLLMECEEIIKILDRA